MTKFTHTYDFAFEVTSSDPEGGDVTSEMLIKALRDRVARIEQGGGIEMLEACCLYDTSEVAEGAHCHVCGITLTEDTEDDLMLRECSSCVDQT